MPIKTFIMGLVLFGASALWGISQVSSATEHSTCAGSSHKSRYLGNGWHEGCVTGYASWESTGAPGCGGINGVPRYSEVPDNLRIAAIAPSYFAEAPCGSIVAVRRGSVTIFVKRIDSGPCWNPCQSASDTAYNRDMDLSYAASRALGKGASWWADPILVRWKVVKRP